MYQRGAVTLFHVKGVPVRAHWTLLLILPYLAIVFSEQFERVAHVAGIAPESLRGPPLVWGALLALALFASVAVHELAHTLVAIARGGRVSSSRNTSRLSRDNADALNRYKLRRRSPRPA